jgi:hypothetical protein
LALVAIPDLTDDHEGKMTNEEMAAELRKAGWSVQEPITQANCTHPNMHGAGGISCDGSGYSESYCMRCGYRSRNDWGPKKDYKPLIPMN